MVYCSVSGCKSNSGRKSENETVQFHRFPSDIVVRNFWIKACGKKLVNTKNARICSLHFNLDHYSLKSKLLNVPVHKRQLCKTAVPTLLLPTEEKISERTSRAMRKARKKEVQDILKETPSTSKGDLDCALQLEIFNLRKENEILKRRVEDLRKENMQKQNEKDNLQSSISHIFTENQIKKLSNPGKLVKWNTEDISSAISLYSAGPRSYRLMRKRKHPLPGVSTLRKWARKINMQPGILKNILKLMEKTHIKEYEKICTLFFDEMKIKASYEYDKVNDIVLKPSNYVQVIMARGLSAKWKQPVFYNYDCNMTTSILNEIISELYHIGYMVVGVVCDMGPGNQNLWKELQIGLMKTWFLHPENPQKKVFVFADAPHLLKLVRNHFIDTGFVYGDKLINIEPIKELALGSRPATTPAPP